MTLGQVRGCLWMESEDGRLVAGKISLKKNGLFGGRVIRMDISPCLESHEALPSFEIKGESETHKQDGRKQGGRVAESHQGYESLARAGAFGLMTGWAGASRDLPAAGTKVTF